jgi:signal transduction histidine kinase
MALRLRVFAIATAVVSALSGAVLVVPGFDGPVRGFLADVAYPLFPLAGGAAVALAALRLRGRERLAWSLVGAGVVCTGLGDVLWVAYGWFSLEVPYPGWPDVFYLASYALWFAAVFTLPHALGDRFDRIRMALDGMAGAVAMSGAIWALFLLNLAEPEGVTGLERFVTVAYPIGDGMVLTAIVLLGVRHRTRGRDWRVVALALGLVATGVGDLLYLIDLEQYSSGVWYDGIWLLGYAAFTWCAVALLSPPPASQPATRRVPILDVVLSYLVVAAMIGVSSHRVITARSLDDVTRVLLAGTGLVVVIVLIRVGLGIAENRNIVERERRELIASVSHELRTPLTTIQGFIELLNDPGVELPESDRMEMLETVASQSRSLGRIVTDLIEVSRGELTSTRLSPEEYRLREAVDAAVVAAGLDPERVTVDTDDAAMVADRQRFTQIVVNLLTNAQRYGAGSIVVRARRRGSSTVVEVHDDGPGVNGSSGVPTASMPRSRERGSGSPWCVPSSKRTVGGSSTWTPSSSAAPASSSRYPTRTW